MPAGRDGAPDYLRACTVENRNMSAKGRAQNILRCADGDIREDRRTQDRRRRTVYSSLVRVTAVGRQTSCAHTTRGNPPMPAPTVRAVANRPVARMPPGQQSAMRW